MRRICRTCLKEISSTDFVSIDSTAGASLNSTVVKQELAICVPELDLKVVANPVVCAPCINDLHVAYDFKRKCLQTEERIYSYVQNKMIQASCVELSNVINCNSSKGNIDEKGNFALLNNYEASSGADCDIKLEEQSFSDSITSESFMSNAERNGGSKNTETNAVQAPLGGSMKRRTFTIEDKMDIIRRIDGGAKLADVCRQTGLASSTVACIIKKKDAILKAFEKNGINLKRLRKPRYADIDEALAAWCKEQVQMQVVLNGPALKLKARELAQAFGSDDFSCSNGWLDRFKTRYNICLRKRKS